ncbi:MAG: SoxR reducing system RseC family protein [Pseudomonadales bacterium]|jgi:positive regulator of sigma E activity|nr:SoxR reducing system RseC family protein [Pseudomonadales bacterium]
MLSEPAVVTAASDGRLLLRADRAPRCATCTLKRGCGQSLLGTQRALTLNLPSAAAIAPGTQVRLAVAERDLLQLIGCFYLPPLLLLLGAALLGWRLGLSELLQFCCVALGLALGVGCSHLLLRRHRLNSQMLHSQIPNSQTPTLQIVPAAPGESLS